MWFRTLAVAAVATWLTGCAAPRQAGSEASRDRGRGESTAHKAGEAAYDLSQKAKKAAKVAGREIKDAAKDASAGWKDAKREAASKGK